MTRPRIAFLGTGWIGRHRMAAMLETGAVEAVAVADPSSEMAAEAARLAPGAAIVPDLEAILALKPDGVVIATPSALHAEQSIAALRAGAAVFCQKPLGRSAAEAASVVAAAREADRLLGVDFSYRFTSGMRAIVELVRAGELGHVFAADLVFHNAYGPDKAWFYDRALSGGGCVMDLGVHLVDLALWVLGFPEARDVSAQLLAGGAPVAASAVEDYAAAQVTLSPVRPELVEGPSSPAAEKSGASTSSARTGVGAQTTALRLACSWRLPAGQDAVIEASFYGTNGGASFRNVGGSFYDFEATRFRGTAREPLAAGAEEWGARAAVDWARRLAAGERFSADAERLVDVSRVLDLIYANG